MSQSYYDTSSRQFIENSIHVDMHNLYDEFETYLHQGAHILDAGCGSGRDSLYFVKRGYQITAMDASIEMCNYASKLLGSEVKHQTFEEIQYTNQYEGIWACASLLHVSFEELPDVMKKLCDALHVGGVLYASWKLGDAERIEEGTGRFYCDLNEERFYEVVSQIPSFEVCKIWISQNQSSVNASQKWFNVILKRKI